MRKREKIKKMETKPEEHKTHINAYYDGDLIYLWLDGVYAWYDDEYTHKIYLVNKPQFYLDLLKSLEKSIDNYEYKIDVVPQLKEEVGDVDFIDDHYGG
jgi:hypothetical protein